MQAECHFYLFAALKKFILGIGIETSSEVFIENVIQFEF
jgi:hypothetical protein